MSAFDMEFEVQCPNDGLITVGLPNVEGIKIHSGDHAELLVRCPKCGALISIVTQLPTDMPAALMRAMEAISHGMESPMNENRITTLFTQMEGLFSGFGFDAEEPEYSPRRELNEDEESHLGYFRSELDKIESVDDFLKRANDD